MEIYCKIDIYSNHELQHYEVH